MISYQTTASEKQAKAADEQVKAANRQADVAGAQMAIAERQLARMQSPYLIVQSSSNSVRDIVNVGEGVASDILCNPLGPVSGNNCNIVRPVTGPLTLSIDVLAQGESTPARSLKISIAVFH